MGFLKIDFCPPTKRGHQIVESFERGFAAKTGVKFCVAVNSGYSALFLTLRALGIKDGDEVIIPDFTMIATAHAVSACGAKPVMVDVELETGNIDPNKIEKAITKKTRAIIPVHVYGHPADMDPILVIARRHKLKVVEDAAEAHGAEYKKRKVGNLADAGCFSFYGNKIISTGEGGAITTNSRKLAEETRKLRSYYFEQGYRHEKTGWSFRMNPLGALSGIKEMKKMRENIQKRRKIADFYARHIDYFIHLVKPLERIYAKRVYWMYGLKMKTEREKKKLKKYLAKRGIETRDFFYPISRQPMYRQTRHKNADELSKTGILLPSMPTLTKKELEHIVLSVNNYGP